MNKKRPIIEINEDLCTGCGECILACAEGALKLVNGKAKLVSDVYCDGLGACLGECPAGALKIVERDAEDFDEEAVKKESERASAQKRDQSAGPAKHAFSCPGSAAFSLKGAGTRRSGGSSDISSTLSHWPVKLQLLHPRAPFLAGADLVLMADCAGVAYPNLHRDLLTDRAVAIGCPKFDDLDAHIERLADILRESKPKSLTVVHLEVPCCHGFLYAAKKAVELSGTGTPLFRKMISRTGEILAEEPAGMAV